MNVVTDEGEDVRRMLTASILCRSRQTCRSIDVSVLC